MWASSDVTVSTAQAMVKDISRKKRLAFHVLSLKMSRVSKEILEGTQLMPALSKHAYHPGIGVAVRGLLDRFLSICQGKKDDVNGLFETRGNPFRQPLERKSTKPKVRKLQVKTKRDTSLKDGSEFSDTEDSDADWSDTDIEDEVLAPCASLLFPLKVKKECVVIEQSQSLNTQEIINNEVQKKHVKDEPVAEPREKGQSLKRKIQEDHRFPKTARKEQEKSKDHLDSVVDSLVSKIFEEASFRPKTDFEQATKKELTSKAAEEDKKPKFAPLLSSEKENTWPKEFGRQTLIVPGIKPEIAVPRSQPLQGNPVNSVRVLSKNQRNALTITEKKLVKEEKMLKKTKKMTTGLEIFQVSKVKKEPVDLPERDYCLAQDVKKLADKLNVLPLEPSRDQILSILPGANARILSEAEKLIGRKMRRVNRVWWEMLLRDFGPIDPSQNVGDVRDIYTAKQMFADRKRLRDKAAGQPPNPLERVFATLH